MWKAKGLVAKGKALANSGRHAEALPLLEEAVRLDTSSGNAWHFLGVTEIGQKAPGFNQGMNGPLPISTPGCYTTGELWLSPWGIMAWSATPRSPRL